MRSVSSLRLLTVLVILLPGLLAGCLIASKPSPYAAPAKAEASVQENTISASDPRFVYEGRFDTSNPAAPGIVWQASRIRLGFDGDSIALKFSDVKGQVYLNAKVDGLTLIVELHEGREATGTTLTGLGAGRHELTLFKRSEAAAGTAHFAGVTLAAGAQAFAGEKPAYKNAYQFFGDSITVGACNEDGETDQWEDRRTHNNALSYGAFTAAAFDADYRNIAVSGMGIVTGWIQPKASEIWDRVYPEINSPKADLTQWKPNVIFINLGENDDSFTKAKNLPFPSAEYTDGYVALVQSIRAAYPDAHIVILRGGMFGGAQSERLRGPWEAAVEKIEAADKHVSHFVFKHWSQTHPRVTDHSAMASELVAWLKTQDFVK
jgi:lysophospholipase L1-like esterase